MKRTNSAAIASFPHTAADVERRIFDLATDRERSNNRFDTQLQAPQVYQDDPRLPGFFHLPQDILNQIGARLDKHGMRTIASSCRTGYLIAEAWQPMYRSPGLLADLKLLKIGNCDINPESFKAFLQAIATDGTYDRALLTTLSPKLRCTIAVALYFRMYIWHRTSELHENNLTSLIKLNAKFIANHLNVDFLTEIKEIFRLLTIEQDSKKWMPIALTEFLVDVEMDVNIKSQIFTAFLDVLCDTSIGSLSKVNIDLIAEYHALNLTIRTIGISALLDKGNGLSSRKLRLLLSNAKTEELKQDVCEIIDVGIAKKLFSHLPTWRAVQISGCFLDAAQKLDESGKAAILDRLISIFHGHIFSYARAYSDFDHAFNPENANKSNLATILENPYNHGFSEYVSLGNHMRLLTEQAASLTNATVAISLVQRVYEAISFAKTVLPHFDAYIARTIEELSMRS